MSLAFAECGAKRSPSPAAKLNLRRHRQGNPQARQRWSAHAVHVGKWEDHDRLCEEVYKKWGRCDVLINNAGLSPLALSLLETSEDLFDKVIAVNLKGPFRPTALFATRMAAGEGGSGD